MFRKILIANRGEIACRVIRTARRLGVATVAVYSDVDAGALHVEMADEAVHIGGNRPAESYLKGDTIIEAARETGAQAIHPGYGFLSENPEFVEAVEKVGLVFIGPSAAAIRSMGLKDAAKALMEKAGVPVVPGYHGADQSVLKSHAKQIGYPVLIKAVAGGGGKGMRLVEQAKDFESALASARAEALAAFGNEAMLVEKFVEKPRHIEIQVFGDGKDVVHLFERDCSLQRRHQKVIEEAPAPGMTPQMRLAMGNAAVQAAKAIKYSGAGTVEFIVDASDGLRPDRFWFMEMNTRLQVEHPVTEAIIGIDLVEWQLRVAAGEKLPKSQEQLSINGHAFEARLYAEDVPRGFLPATGTLTQLRFPVDVRADTGVRAGDEISPHYDPMIAKIVTFGATREIALKQLSAAISATEIAGTVTNQAFLAKLAAQVNFVAGEVDTRLIERNLTALAASSSPSRDAICQAILAVAVMTDAADWTVDWSAGFSLWAPLCQSVKLLHGEQEILCTYSVFSSQHIAIKTAASKFDSHRQGADWFIDGRKLSGRAMRIGQTISVFGDPAYHFALIDPLAMGGEDPFVGDVVLAPMPGAVRALSAKAGQNVKKGDVLVVLEAMKMEHALVAPRNGRIAEVMVAIGDQVKADMALLRLEELE